MSTTHSEKQMRARTVKYQYTRRYYESTLLPTEEPEVTTAKSLTKKEHKAKLKELYERYKTTDTYTQWKHLKLGTGPVHFGLLDVRVGRVTHVEYHEESSKLYVCDVDIGIGRPVQVVTGLGRNIDILDLVMRWVIVLVNIKPTTIMGIESEAKIICAVSPELVDPLYPPENSEPGDIVTVKGFPVNPVPVLDPDQRHYPMICKRFNTNNESIACYKGIPWVVEGKGFVSAFNMPRVLVR